MQNARRHLRELRLSVLLEWHRVAQVSRKLNYYCLRLMHRRDIRAPVISEWHRAAVQCSRLKRCCLQIMLRLDDSILKKMFDEWRTSWVASADVGRMSASRAAVIKQASSACYESSSACSLAKLVADPLFCLRHRPPKIYCHNGCTPILTGQ